MGHVNEIPGAEFLPTSETSLPRALGNYVLRLQRVADKSFRRGDLLRGTTILNPSVLCYDRRGELHEKKLWNYSMYNRVLPLKDGSMLATYPLKTAEIAADGTPIIAERARGSWYSIVHVPADMYRGQSLSNPASLTIDFAFTVNKKDVVFVAGMQEPDPSQRLVFDAIVGELERRVEGVTPADEQLAMQASRHR